MEYWEICEDKVRKITGGRRTPGSGNKSIKGDVVVPGYTFEVKSTIKDEINIEFNWLLKLEKEFPKTQPILIVFLGDGSYYCWMLDNQHNIEVEPWTTKKFNTNTVPELLIGPVYNWVLQENEILKEL